MFMEGIRFKRLTGRANLPCLPAPARERHGSRIALVTMLPINELLMDLYVLLLADLNCAS
jgi:hypothetical protein